MVSRSHKEIRFTAGVVIDRDDLWILTESPFRTKKGTSGGGVVSKRPGSSTMIELSFAGQIGIEVSPSRATPAPRVTFFDAEGQFERAGAGQPRVTGFIDTSANGPKGKGWIRGVRRIGDQVFAVGMSRQAYVRNGEIWQRIDADILAKDGEIAGLNDIDGFDSDEVYSAGLNGEIWRFDGQRWHSVPSPTNVQLNSVRRYDEYVYIAGSSGIVVRGRGDAFSVVATESSKANFYAIEGFNESVYLASMSALYRLGDDGVEKIRLKVRPPITAGSLHAADGILLSVGVNHVFTTNDGALWTQVFA